MKKKITFILLAVLITSLTSAFAKTIWSNGRNIVRSSELGDLIYEGSMYLYPADEMVGSYSGRYAHSGWIRYKSNADRRTKTEYTGKLRAEGFVTAVLRFRDTLCWDCPKTTFNYDFYTESYPKYKKFNKSIDSQLKTEYLDPDVKITLDGNHTRGEYTHK